MVTEALRDVATVVEEDLRDCDDGPPFVWVCDARPLLNSNTRPFCDNSMSFLLATYGDHRFVMRNQ
eukprot:m.72479 g.72479  ORF g.72479 m.72479 type:complete len:66 (+) comp12336_c1_seq5:139-336(+)